MRSGKFSVSFKTKIFIAAAAAILLFSAAVNNGWLKLSSIYRDPLLTEAFSYDFSVHYIDVGQGDCIYITNNGYDILIDAGNTQSSSAVLEYLQKCEVDDFEIVIATHTDSDHIGGMDDIVQNYEIGEFWLFKESFDQSEPTSAAYGLYNLLEQYSVPVVSVRAGKYAVCSDMRVDVLSPYKTYSNDNDNSVAVKITYGGNSFLFMGDASKSVEKDLLLQNSDVSADVLKLSHHGSKSASSEDFLAAVNPAFAVISVGENSYGLPSQDILKRLNGMQIDYYRTDLYGNIVVASDGTKLYILTSKAA